MTTELVLLGADWARRAGAGFGGITTAGRDGLRRVLPRVT
jgi:hypothetical protein